MLSLDLKKLAEISIPVGTGWLLGSCMEARGKQDLWIRQKPEVLEVLREQAIIQSVESSNRLEGVTIPADRLRPVVLGKAKPRDRSEEELAGYRQALDWIFSRQRQVSVTPAVVQRLHALAQGGFSGDAGEWKKRDNEVIEILPGGERKIRFIPTSAKDTPKTTELLCRNYRSLERLVEESKEDYYGVLAECSRGWHQDQNEIVPWWNFFLSVLRSAYKEFERQVESVEARPAKSDLVRKTILLD